MARTRVVLSTLAAAAVALVPAALAHVPAMWVLAGVALLAWAWLPRAPELVRAAVAALLTVAAWWRFRGRDIG